MVALILGLIHASAARGSLKGLVGRGKKCIDTQVNPTGVEAELLSKGRDRFLDSQMPADDLGFLFRCVATTTGTHGLTLRSVNCPADHQRIPFSTGAGSGPGPAHEQVTGAQGLPKGSLCCTCSIASSP